MAQKFTASAPGKIILFGEHAVVYGRPALAAPVFKVQATATVTPSIDVTGLFIEAPDLGPDFRIRYRTDDPLSRAAQVLLESLNEPEPDVVITIRSTVPIAAGLGSGASVSAALIKALAGSLGHTLETSKLNELVFEIEKLHHGTPSGIDNTVVCYEQPVYFIKDQEPELVPIGHPFDLIIGDTGIQTKTHIPVGQVRDQWKHNRDAFEGIFNAVADVVNKAKDAIKYGEYRTLGPLMDENHELLRQMGVSSGRLNELCAAARLNGALGAKLSGAGQGGNMIALTEPEQANRISDGLLRAGATSTIHTTVE